MLGSNLDAWPLPQASGPIHILPGLKAKDSCNEAARYAATSQVVLTLGSASLNRGA